MLKAQRFTRRHLIQGAAAALAILLPSPAALWALGNASKLDLAEIILPAGLARRSSAWVRLLHELVQTTSIEALPQTTQLGPSDPALFDHPLAVMAGAGQMSDLNEDEVIQLSRFLRYGGFLFVDDTSGTLDSPFDSSFRQLCRRLFPNRPLSVLPSDHSVYRSFFLIEKPVGRLAISPYLEGISTGETTPLIYSRNDVSGALARSPDGRDAFQVLPGGDLQRREATKLGINLLVYALTSNYKKDMAHVRRLMLEGRLP